MQLSDEELIDWLRLIRSDNIGPKTFQSLVAQFGTAANAVDALPELARRSGKLFIRIPDKSEAEKELALARLSGITFIPSCDERYPSLLREIDTAPPLLTMKGDMQALHRPMVAIVGSRNASAAGLRMTERLARQLGEAGFTVVSGLARGIDTKAHQASLVRGTIAVIAGGHMKVYPSQNIPLADAIVDNGGLVISEMPLNWEPRARDFPRRNRIVSGLSYGVVVVEAAKRSGSLITANLALDQGREVFAVPGSPLDPRAEGPNELIRQGAILCGSTEHIIEALEPVLGLGRLSAQKQEASLPEHSELLTDHLPSPQETEKVLQFLSPVPTSVDDIVQMSGLSFRVIQTALLELELTGRLERSAGNRVALSA
ncbi:DNA-processing protein DprA [Microvirga sp. W0021]|uniref:DNA-processing protein DprA n=1 Tax=Hohaiivirga grylli TaxID=3133970 RepID=A0ABV0BJI9_9HYPH